MRPIILQLETVGPEGYKLLWVLIALILVAFIVFLAQKNLKLPFSIPTRKVKITLTKNKIYHPTTIHLSISNQSSKAIVIENPVIRFRRLYRKKAYKIKSVNTKSIYPLFLEANKTHDLSVSLEPFYEFNRKLKRYSRLRIEFTYNKTRKKNSRYILLKSTLFRKAKR